ncbi:hypothetical protein LSAT2_018449 [Lamellibrachia satsuma]|nr:hypothetical protein LSAT2_018449 [Lamellibrachia satsuma]
MRLQTSNFAFVKHARSITFLGSKSIVKRSNQFEISSFVAAVHAMSCSRCNSDKDVVSGECQSAPPTPSLCFGQQISCMTAREFNASGDQIRFIRDCSGMEEQGETCRDRTDNKGPARICYTICITYGCNNANVRFVSPALVLLLPIIVSIVGGVALGCR